MVIKINNYIIGYSEFWLFFLQYDSLDLFRMICRIQWTAHTHTTCTYYVIYNTIQISTEYFFFINFETWIFSFQLVGFLRGSTKHTSCKSLFLTLGFNLRGRLKKYELINFKTWIFYFCSFDFYVSYNLLHIFKADFLPIYPFSFVCTI